MSFRSAARAGKAWSGRPSKTFPAPRPPPGCVAQAKIAHAQQRQLVLLHPAPQRLVMDAAASLSAAIRRSPPLPLRRKERPGDDRLPIFLRRRVPDGAVSCPPALAHTIQHEKTIALAPNRRALMRQRTRARPGVCHAHLAVAGHGRGSHRRAGAGLFGAYALDCAGHLRHPAGRGAGGGRRAGRGPPCVRAGGLCAVSRCG